MPLPSLHPSLPQNPTTAGSGFAASSSFGRAVGSSVGGGASSAAGGSVNRETLKTLQDVVWSDDEDDPECLLCTEPLDLSDLNFKPCQCGLQICQFCYNKLLGSDARCPGCRRPYDQKSVIFQPVDFEEVKKAKEKKTKRAKTIKQLTAMGRRHLLGTRVVMKNMVYVTGMPLPALTLEESISILRTHEYFGQYGKISKIYTRERSSLSASTVHTLSLDDPATSHGIYIIYSRREDAARAIALINANSQSSGFSASHGTTRYCDAFLRGMKCDNPSCHNLHEWGGDSDCFSKDDYETALTRPAEYDARQKQAAVAPPSLTIKSHWPKPNPEDAGSSALPNSAGWGKNISVKTVPANKSVNGTKSLKIGNMVSLKSNSAFPLPSPSVLPIGSSRTEKKKSMSMSRGKSSDSTQSTNPPSSAQTSPKKKPISLSSSTSISSKPPLPPPGIPPPPGLTPLDKAPVSAPPVPIPTAEPLEEMMPEESTSAESEAGPSSGSPAPQTPSQPSEPPLPAPLTSEPIFVHSPYEEPEIISFPTTIDPNFEFLLGLDLGDASLSGASVFTPTPFSKISVGLAELGVLSTELPDFYTASRTEPFHSSNFHPFDLSSSLHDDEEDTSMAGPSRTRETTARPMQREHEREEELEEQEPPRTTSRFDFARQQSHTPQSFSRGQSPFALRSHGTGSDWGMGMSRQPLPQQHQQQQQQYHPQNQQHQQQMMEEHLIAQRQQQQHTGESRLAQQVASFVGSYSSDWSQGQGSEYIGSPIRLDGRMSQLSLGRPGQNQNQQNQREEYDATPYPPSGPQRLFSPESSIHEDQHYHPSHSQHSQYTPLHQNFYQQQQQQQQSQQQTRTPPPGPGPVSINPHSFRRY